MEKIDKRFGIVAVESGFITRQQLFEALKVQLADDLKGMKHRLIGEILRAKEYITKTQIDKVIESMSF